MPQIRLQRGQQLGVQEIEMRLCECEHFASTQGADCYRSQPGGADPQGVGGTGVIVGGGSLYPGGGGPFSG
jgi:hypothetical protein